MLGLKMNAASNGNDALTYQTSADPKTDYSKLFVLEANGENYAMRCVSLPHLPFQTEWGTGTSDTHWRLNDAGGGDASWYGLSFNYEDNAWTLTSTKYSQPLGIYNNVTGTPTEGAEIGTNTTGNGQKFQIYAISKSDFVQGASVSTPVDVTAFIKNYNFNLRTSGKGDNTYGWTVTKDNGGNYNFNGAVERWHGTLELSQTLTDIPNGKYQISVQMGNGDNSNTAYLYATANGNTNQAIVTKSIAKSNFADENTNMNADATYGKLTVDAIVTDGTLTTGIKETSTNTWIVFDNFSAQYFGTTIINDAVALPSNGSMEAGKWYYVDIPMAGDDYNAKADNLDNIVYTIDGTILTADATTSVTTTFKATGNSLAATRYYVRSTTAQTLAITPASYTYVAGTATADVAYIQAGNTVTVTYSGFETNDPSATLTKDFSGVTFNGTAVTCTATEGNNGFTFTVPTTVEANKEYTLSIPAKAIGYSNGDGTYNEAQELTFTTPVALDGVYYLYSPKFDRYLSRGSWWGTRAIVDIYGYPFQLTTDNTGLTTIKGVDNNGYIYSSYWLYADGAADQANHFKMEASTVEGYTDSGNIRFLNNELGGINYLYVNSDELGNYSYGVAGNSIIDGNAPNITGWDQTVWQLESVADHNTKMAAKPTTNKTNVITAAGLSTTADEFVTYLSNNYGATDKTSLISAVASSSAIGTGWTWNVSRNGTATENYRHYDGYPNYTDPYARLYETTGYYTYTVSKDSLTAGIYKVKVAGFDRRTLNNDGDLYTTYGNIGASYVRANDEQVRIKSWKEMFDAANQDDSWDGQAASMTNGYADNEVYVYLDGSTDLSITVEKPDYAGGSYLCFGNVQLTYYEAKATEADKTALSEAITAAEKNTLGFEAGEYAPYNNVDAIKALAAAKAINTETASSAEVTAATSAINNATWTANTEEVNAIAGGDLLDSYTHYGQYDHANGWGNAGYNTRIVGINESLAADNPGLKGTTNSRALLVKFNTSYGDTTGYKLPLKANTTYKFSFTYGLWNESGTITKGLTVTDPNGTEISMTPGTVSKNEGSKDSCANKLPTAWYTYEAYFTTTDAGNYVLNITNPDGNNQRQMVFADLVLKKAVASDISLYDTETAAPSLAYGTVTLNRTFAAGWNSLVLPFATTKAELGADEIAAYTGTDATTIKLETTETLKANTPYLVYFEKAPTSITFSEAKLVNPSGALTVEDAGTTKQYNFVGTYAALVQGNTTITNGDYIVVSTGIKGTNGGNPIKAFRAFFDAQSTTDAAKRMVLSIDGDVVTAIDGVSVDSLADDDAPAYNLAGQRVGKSYKGVVVKNGKKLIRK